MTKCGHCSNCYLLRDVEVNDMDFQDVLRCPLCGWRHYRTTAAAGRLHRDIPKKELFGRVFNCNSGNYERVRTKRCKVLGCKSELTERNSSGFCAKHLRVHQGWESRCKTTHPPFVESPDIAGMLIANPLRGQRR